MPSRVQGWQNDLEKDCKGMSLPVWLIAVAPLLRVTGTTALHARYDDLLRTRGTVRMTTGRSIDVIELGLGSDPLMHANSELQCNAHMCGE